MASYPGLKEEREGGRKGDAEVVGGNRKDKGKEQERGHVPFLLLPGDTLGDKLML
jgi:hypothetical protein